MFWVYTLLKVLALQIILQQFVLKKGGLEVGNKTFQSVYVDFFCFVFCPENNQKEEKTYAVLY